MNISQKFLLNNGLSEEKKQFYEAISNRYSKISSDFLKKNNQDHLNFNKKVLNWLFSQNEETRMLLCAVENKKYTNTIHYAYSYVSNHSSVKFKFSEDDIKDDDKFKFEPSILNSNNKNNKQNIYNFNYGYNDNYYYNNRKNPYFNKTLKELEKAENELLNNINFYQSESTIDDINVYSSYFTLKKDFLKNEEQFKKVTNILSYNSFLSNPIRMKRDMQLKTVLSFELPCWITSDFPMSKNKDINYEDDEDNYNYGETSNNKYFSLAQYCLALIEQVLCVRYLIYYQSRNLKEIISSIYLKDLLAKKELMLSFLNSMDFDISKFYEKFEIGDIFTRLFYNQSIEEFIKEKSYKIDDITKDDEKINFEENYKEAKMNLNIFENEQLIIELANFFGKDKKSFNDEIINNCIFFNIKKLYSYDDFLWRLIFEKIHEEYSKKICDDLIMDDAKKTKKKKKKKKKNSNEIKDNNNDINYNKEVREKMYSFVKNLLLEKLDKKLNELNSSNNNYINNSYKKEKNSKKKEKEFFLYQPTKKEKKKNNNASNNNNNKNKKKNSLKNSVNEIKIIEEEKKEYKEDKKGIIINNKININKNNVIINNINNISIQSHINSFTLSSSSTSSDSTKRMKSPNSSKNIIKLNSNEFQDYNNNQFVVHQNPILISYKQFPKLTDDIINFNNDLESLLIIMREIKYQIRSHFDFIIHQIFKKGSLKLEIYGSSLYLLDIESSDLDISISSSDSDINLENIVTFLNSNNDDKKYLNINFISTASIPIIKLDVDFLKLNNSKINELYKKLQKSKYYEKCLKDELYKTFNIIKVDISLNSINYNQIKFIKQGITQYPQIIFLIKILKKLLLYKHMNNSYKGGMSSYCLFLLLYSYFKMYSNIYNVLDNNYSSLLTGFLFYYNMCIDFKYTIIDPRLNNPFIYSNYPVETIPTIIEPTTMKNAGKNIYKIFDVLKTFNEIYRDIYNIIKTEENNDSDNINDIIDDNNNDKNYIYELFKLYISDNYYQ